METARFLLEVGVNGFATNKLGRSPLSMAIEVLPELALELLKTKSRFEYRWWGNDLYWFSFSGVVLNSTTWREDELPTAAAPQLMASAEHGAAAAPQLTKPLAFQDGNGKPATIEELIVRHERKELLETPVMLDLIERKWLYFAGDLYRNRFLTFAAMLLSVFIVSAVDTGSALFYSASASTAITWVVFLRDEIRQLANKAREDGSSQTGGFAVLGIKLIDVIDLYNVILVPVLLGYRLAVDAGVASFLSEGTAEVLASLSGALQVTLALTMLRLVAQFRVLGPLLITVYQMINDALLFAVIIFIVLFGYANGFFSLIHFGASDEYLASLDFDYSYTSIVTNMCLWLTGQPDLELIKPLAPGVQVGAQVLFWSFIITSYFVLLNLLIAIFNTTYERVLSNSVAEWLFVRLRTTLQFEAADSPGVRAYYDQLQARDNQRAVRGKTVVQASDDETFSIPKWAEKAKSAAARNGREE